MHPSKHLLSVIELGGYPDFSPLYQAAGYDVHSERSVRNAIRTMKKLTPDVIVAEFNFQSDFRDRTSSLESLLSTVQRMENCRVIVFYEKEYQTQLDKLTAQYDVYVTLPFPIDQNELGRVLQELASGQPGQ